MITKYVKKCFLLVGTIILIWATYQGGCYAYWLLRAISTPSHHSKMVDSVKILPSQKVIKKLYSLDYFSPYPQIAIQILAERREKEAVPGLIKLLKSRNGHIRRDAILALGLINDKRAIEPLMQIVKQGEKHSEYRWAMISLSRMRHEEVFHIVVDIANKPYPKNCAAIGMLKDYGKEESINLLLKIKDTIKEGSPNYRSYKASINDAITAIRDLNK